MDKKGRKKKMKKILFGITGLTLGGAERVLVDIANQLCNIYEITIFTIYAKGELEKQLSEKVKVKSLYNMSYSEQSKFQKYFAIPLKILLLNKIIYDRKIKKDYDVEVAFLEGPITRLFSINNKTTKKIAWIHNDIALVFGNGIKAKIKKKLDEKVYQKYEELIFVSKDNQKKFEEIYSLTNKKEVIYNYINAKEVIEKANKNENITWKEQEINIVTVARLVNQKAIDRLINVHSKLIKEGFDHAIYVIGDGPEKNKLQNMIQDKKVESSFFLLGKKENPYPYIKQADYFCLLSYFEGYGMVLEEAKILGKPIIITDTAAREAIENYKNSTILANDEKAIYEGLKKMIKKEEKSVSDETKKDYDNTDIIEKIIGVLEKK